MPDEVFARGVYSLFGWMMDALTFQALAAFNERGLGISD